MPVELIKCNRDSRDIQYTWKGSGHDVSSGMFKDMVTWSAGGQRRLIPFTGTGQPLYCKTCTAKA